jgi:CHAD domain-containing protein
LLALYFLEDATEAERHLGDANDPETLHDFPVALRRLRSCLRAYGEELKDSVPNENALAPAGSWAVRAGRDTEIERKYLLSSLPEPTGGRRRLFSTMLQ